MSKVILYGNRESGHAYKAKLALTLLGLDHEYREVDLQVPPERRRADFREVAPFGEVPVLVDGADVLAQSNAILLHLARRSGRLGGELDPDRLAEWLFWEANRIGFSVANLRAVRTYAAGTTDPAVAGWLETRTRADLDRLARELAVKSFLLGGQITVVDISCSAYLLLADEARLDLSPWPAVGAWLDRIRAQPGWAPLRVLMH